MIANDLHYPILCLTKYGVASKKTDVELTTTFQASLDKGWFRDAELIDSSGTKYRIVDAKKIGGVGPFFGYNLFFSRRIRVELTIEEVSREMPVSDVRKLILKDFKNWHGWETRGDYADLKAAIEKALSVADIIRLVAS